MNELFRIVLVVALCLLVPVLPFLGFGSTFDARAIAWLDQSVSQAAAVGIVVGLLSGDVLLPVPSSALSMLAGVRVGIVLGTAAVWLGMTLGAVVAFALARWPGRRLVTRLVGADEYARLAGLAERFGPQLLVATRALPVLAEASVLLVGATTLAWRRFLPAVVLSNLGIAVAYAVLGHLAREHQAVPAALVASIAFPLLAATIARWWMPKRMAAESS